MPKIKSRRESGRGRGGGWEGVGGGWLVVRLGVRVMWGMADVNQE